MMRLTDFFHHNAHSVKLFLDSRPVDNSRLDDVIELEDDQAVGKVAVQMMNERRHSKAIHPIPIHCKTRPLNTLDA